MTPKILIEKWGELFNRGDANRIAELYHLDAVNHQVANPAVEGKTAIREMFANEFAMAEMVCIPENIFEDGEWGFWNGKTLWG